MTIPEGTPSWNVAVSLNPRPLSEFTLNYDVGGTATSGSDYQPLDGMVTVPAGARWAYIPVTFIDDSDREGDETIVLTLTDGSGYRLDQRATTLPLTIVDNEPIPKVTFPTPAARRPESRGKYRIPVRLSPPPGETITLDYTVSGTATPGLDYTIPGLDAGARTGTLSVSAGTAKTYIPVTLIDDSVEDNGETLKLNLTGSPHYRTGRRWYGEFHALLIINNHEANDLEGEVQARLDAAVADGGGASANLWRRALAAVRGEAPPSGLARLTQADAQAQVTAHLGSDIELAALWAEIAEVIGGRVTDPAPAADPEVTIAAGDGITEGGNAVFTLTADPAPAAALDVAVTVAVEGEFGIAAGAQTVTIPTTGSATLTLTTDDDDADEADGSVTATVDAGAGYTVGSASSGTVAIADDDAPAAEPAVTVALAAEGASVAEDNGEVKFTVTLSRALEAGETAVVPFTVTGGRAHRHWNIRFRPKDNGPGVKRTAVERDTAVTFTEGGRVATLVLVARPNLDTEQRTIRVAFGTGEHAPRATGVAGGLAPAGGAIEVAILDDDAAGAPALFVEDARARESAGAMRFAVRLTAPAAEVVRVRARTRDARPASARAGRDYERTGVDLRFRPGETKKHVRVALFDDGHDEGKETFELVLSNAEGAAIADRVAVGTIRNDDPLPAAYLARFGRTVAEQALDGIAARMAADRAPGMQGTLAGQALSFDPAATSQAAAASATPGATSANREAARAMAGIASGLGADVSAPVSASAGPVSATDSFGDRFGAGHGLGQSRTMTARDALLGSSFSLTGQR
ncbi:MAG: hypothetical protein OXP75_09495, partial [Rhodospirillales bacterium]|nr:hypothetical protein [Rhodospirillales bacterium]